MSKTEYKCGLEQELNTNDSKVIIQEYIDSFSLLIEKAKEGEPEAIIMLNCLGNIFKIFVNKSKELLESRAGLTDSEAQLTFVYAAQQYAAFGLEVFLDKDIMGIHDGEDQEK